MIFTMVSGPNIHTYISILARFCHTYISISSIFTVKSEKTIKKTSNTSCYIEMYFGGLGTFHRYLSSEKGQTYIQTFRCNNFLTPKISLYVSETTVNIEQIRFYMHRKPCIFENHSKYRAFSGTMVNIERMHGWMDGWMDLENLKTRPCQNLHENVLLETVWERFLLFRVGEYTEMADHHKN